MYKRLFTLSPIPIDLIGVVKLSSSVARVEERLQLLVNGNKNAIIQSRQQQSLSLILNDKIPNNLNWTVKMWHFGRDGLYAIVINNLK
jgi:hypothetical protein